MSNLTVITPPAGAALSLAAAKEYLRIGHDGEDGLVAALISPLLIVTCVGLLVLSFWVQIAHGHLIGQAALEIEQRR